MQLVDDQGVEPRAPESTDLQSAAVANAAHHPDLYIRDRKDSVSCGNTLRS